MVGVRANQLLVGLIDHDPFIFECRAVILERQVAERFAVLDDVLGHDFGFFFDRRRGGLKISGFFP
jgi:hypothetical protein